MSAFEQFKTMADLQDKINSKISDTWRDNGNAWYRAIWIEAAEMMDHIHYKWWKSGEMDKDQAHLELVDIFHFALSDLLEKKGGVDDVANYLITEWDGYDGTTASALETVEELAKQTLDIKGFAPTIFFAAMKSVGMSLQELFELYVCKNVLNSFRQDKGYKDASITYHKVFGGKEDNEHLMDVARTIPSDDPDFITKLYSGLEAIYPA